MGIDADIVINVGDADIIIVYTTSEKKNVYMKKQTGRGLVRGLVWFGWSVIWFGFPWDGWMGGQVELTDNKYAWCLTERTTTDQNSKEKQERR